ncbi:hypothetical protein FB451DRAFT_1178379 [Mycena latifolia]|nr:hypothetical protein FB451DRAFT_1178379 [Mycena latifolia]
MSPSVQSGPSSKLRSTPGLEDRGQDLGSCETMADIGKCVLGPGSQSTPVVAPSRDRQKNSIGGYNLTSSASYDTGRPLAIPQLTAPDILAEKPRQTSWFSAFLNLTGVGRCECPNQAKGESRWSTACCRSGLLCTASPPCFPSWTLVIRIRRNSTVMRVAAALEATLGGGCESPSSSASGALFLLWASLAAQLSAAHEIQDVIPRLVQSRPPLKSPHPQSRPCRERESKPLRPYPSRLTTSHLGDANVQLGTRMMHHRSLHNLGALPWLREVRELRRKDCSEQGR